MNVWYISKYAMVPEDGFATRHYFYSKYFARKGINLTLISSNSAGMAHKDFKGFALEREIDGFRHILINGPKINLGFNLKRIYTWIQFEYKLRRLPHKLKLEKPDIIIVSSLSLLTVLTGIKFKKKFGAKLIFEIRDIWPMSLVDLGNVPEWTPPVQYLKMVERRGYRKADYIVGTMPLLYKHVQEEIGRNFRFAYLPTGVDLDFMRKKEPLPKEIERQIPENKFLAGYAGSIGNLNAVDQIVEAARHLQNAKYDNIHILILGDGPLKQKIMEQAQGLKNITFLPKVSKTQVPSFLEKMDVLLHTWPSRRVFQYGVSPNKWVDYMYAAKPILVALDGPGHIIKNAGCGEILPAEKTDILAKKIVEYSQKSKSELVEMGVRGREYLIRKLNYDRLSDNYIRVFNELLEQ